MTEQRTNEQPRTNAWVAAAQTMAAPEPERPSSVEEAADGSIPNDPGAVFVAAHGGAGATSWAAILAGVDGGPVDASLAEHRTGPVVLVARASADGISAAKTSIHQYGAAAFASVLVVPAGPGRVHRVIAAELKVLGGAARVIKAPWLPRLPLKRAQQATPTDLPAKQLTKDLTTLSPRLNNKPGLEGDEE